MGYHKRKMKLYERIQKKDVLLVSKVALFLLFCFATVMFVTQIMQAKHEQDVFMDLANIVAETEQDRSQNADNDDVWESTAEEKTEKPLPQYEDIYAMNNDFIGWLSIPNTKIDYPVMFTPDEPEYYLRRSFDKRDFQSGTPFIGKGGNIDSDCFIIYGHNMKNDTMFGTLDNYVDEDFWKENKTFSFNTLYEYREYEVFATVKTKILYTDENGLRYYNYAGELSEADYKNLEEWLSANSVYNTDISLTYGEQILILSTCSYHTTNGRFVVAARRIK
jgi:sortase B